MLYIYQEASFSGSSSPTSKVDKEGELRIFKEKKESRKAESNVTFGKQESRKQSCFPKAGKWCLKSVLDVYLEALFCGSSSPTSEIYKEGELGSGKLESRKLESRKFKSTALNLA